MLDAQVAQSIVDRTMSVLHINVNIMDAHGIVIAAGSRERVGSFHSTAQQVIQSGRKRVVTEEEAGRLEGVKPGITLPIQYKNQIVGALGMTGDPDVVEKYGELVTLSAVLIIEQAEMRERAFLEQRVRDNILLELFTGVAEDNESLFLQRAKVLDFDFTGPWIVMAVHLLPVRTMTEFHHQQMKDRVESILSGSGMKDLHSCFAKDTLALLWKTRAAAGRDILRRYANSLSDLLSDVEADIRLSIGGICNDWREISATFAFAERSLQITKRAKPAQRFIFAEDHCSEYILSQLSAEQRQRFCRIVLGGLWEQPEQKRMWLDTLRTYYRNDMNVQKTADELFIHRNTLNMRLNKIAGLTGHVPQRFSDAFLLKMALVLLELGPEL